VSVNGTLVEDKMRRFKGEYAHFSFNKCPIYTHDGAGAKFSTNSHETDNSARTLSIYICSPVLHRDLTNQNIFKDRGDSDRRKSSNSQNFLGKGCQRNLQTNL
jgi:hypothetical protein